MNRQIVTCVNNEPTIAKVYSAPVLQTPSVLPYTNTGLSLLIDFSTGDIIDGPNKWSIRLGRNPPPCKSYIRGGFDRGLRLRPPQHEHEEEENVSVAVVYLSQWIELK